METEESLTFIFENEKYKKYIALQSKINKKVYALPNWLEDTETIFKWYSSADPSMFYSWPIKNKLKDYKNQGAFNGFEKFMLLLALLDHCVFRFLFTSDESEEDSESDSGDEEADDKRDDEKDKQKQNNHEDTGENTTLDEPSLILLQCEETLQTMATNVGDTMYNRIGPALEHVLKATKSHFFFLIGNEMASQELAKGLQPITKMSQENLAGIEGMKAKYFMTCNQNYLLSIKISQKAISLDPDFGYWHYLTGKIIRGCRRQLREEMPSEELEYFKKAVELERNPKFLLYLAQANQEAALFLIGKDHKFSSAAHEMFGKAVELYRECWSLKSDAPVIARRIGNGMLKMKKEFIDLKLTKEALFRAVELDPTNNTTYHALGRFYYVHENDDEKALEYFQKFHPGVMETAEIIRLQLIKNADFDATNLVEEWAEIAKSHCIKGNDIYCDVAWFYLIIKNDLETSVKYFWKVLKLNFRSFRVMEFKSYTFCVHGPYNMIEVLLNEIILLKEKNDKLPTVAKKDLSFLENFMEKMMEKHPDLRNISPKPDLVQHLRQVSEQSIAALRQRRYGSSNSKGNKVKEEPGSWRVRQTSENSIESNRFNSWRRDVGNSTYDNRKEDENSTPTRYNWNNQHWNRESDQKKQQNSNYKSSTNIETRAFNFRDRNDRQNFPIRRFEPGFREVSRGQSRYSNNRYDVTVTNWRTENRSPRRDS